MQYIIKKIQFKRGSASHLGQLRLETGEPAFVTDEGQEALYIGSPSGEKILIGPSPEIEETLEVLQEMEEVLGKLDDAASIDPSLSASINAVLKGILTKLAAPATETTLSDTLEAIRSARDSLATLVARDLATEATLLEIRNKDFATAANQTAISGKIDALATEETLQGIESKDFATSANQVTMSNKIDALATAANQVLIRDDVANLASEETLAYIAETDLASSQLQTEISSKIDTLTDTLTSIPSELTQAPLYTVVSVGTDATILPGSPLMGRRVVIIRNASLINVILCNANGTGSFTLEPGDARRFHLRTGAEALYAKVASGTANVEVEEWK
jgi:hypothetical protein